METRAHRAGFTVIEVVIGMAIMSIVVGAVVLAQRTTTRLQSGTTTSGLLEAKAQRAIESVASELRWADATMLLITQENGSDRIDLQTPTGFAADEPTWSTVITYRVEPSRFDADENGVLDEGRLTRTQDGATTTLCDYVVAGGFSATATGGSVDIQLALAKRDSSSNEILASDARTSVSVRN